MTQKEESTHDICRRWHNDELAQDSQHHGIAIGFGLPYLTKIILLQCQSRPKHDQCQ